MLGETNLALLSLGLLSLRVLLGLHLLWLDLRILVFAFVSCLSVVTGGGRKGCVSRT